MPELPEVDAVCHRLRAEALKAEIVAAHVVRPAATRPQRPALIQSKTPGRTIEDIQRRGKNILIQLSGDLALGVHLRMTGDLYVIPDVRFRPATARVYFELNGGRGLIFDDPRLLGKIHLHRSADLVKLLAKVGIEPLTPDFTPTVLLDMARSAHLAAKLFLMDQSRVAGLGNIYAAEALYRAHIHPAKPMNRLRRPKIEALHSAIVTVLDDAVQSARRTYSNPGRFGDAEEFPLYVYDREGEPCDRCRRRIRRIQQGGRSTYFCPGCQK